MIIEFESLTAEELDELNRIEMEHPELITVQQVTAGFDGLELIRLFIEAGAAISPILIALIIAHNKPIIIENNGKKVKLTSRDLKNKKVRELLELIFR